MKKNIGLLAIICLFSAHLWAQTNPAITSFLQNTTVVGSYYTSGNSNAISNNLPVNCQQVEYSATYAYIITAGIPSYPTGPFLDGNPSQAQDQSAIYQLPLNPTQNTGTPTATTGNNIGIFINGVSLFDYRDGVSWDPSTNALCGGPGNPSCSGGPGTVMDWNRDAIPAEKDGFDCSKGHPAMGNYHHHQNPSAFKLDLTVISTICNLYDADGLYSIDSTQHAPLIGFAYDGFPIYGAYGYKNTDGTGGIVRLKSSYALKNMSTRTNGPTVDATYTLGYFREDYEYILNSDPDYLDEHNGRFCSTPEYPQGIYAYFATVDDQWNSAYPYVVGPTFYGDYANRKISTISETTTTYSAATAVQEIAKKTLQFKVYPNPSSDLIAIQMNGLVRNKLGVEMYDMAGKLIRRSHINPGQTLAYFDIQTVYEGTYLLKISAGSVYTTQKISIKRP